jgi:hypothetical protein
MDCEMHVSLDHYFQAYEDWINKVMNQLSMILFIFYEWWKIDYSTNVTQFQESMIFSHGYALMNLLSKAHTH